METAVVEQEATPVVEPPVPDPSSTNDPTPAYPPRKDRHARPPSRFSKIADAFNAAPTQPAGEVPAPPQVDETPPTPPAPEVAPPTAPVVPEVPAKPPVGDFANKQVDLTPYTAEDAPPPVQPSVQPTVQSPAATPPAPVTPGLSAADRELQQIQLVQSIRAQAEAQGLSPDDAEDLYWSAVQPAMDLQTSTLERTIADRYSQLEQKVTSELTGIKEKAEAVYRTQATTAREQVHARLRAIHPDADKILTSAPFVKLMSVTSPYGGASNMQQIIAAYQNNDAEFIERHLKNYLSLQPDVGAVAEVGSSAVGSVPTGSSGVQRMSQKQYSADMLAFRNSKPRTPAERTEIRTKMAALAAKFADAQARDLVDY